MSPNPSNRPKVTKNPTKTKAISLTIDSKAIAKTSPPCLSDESSRLAPNIIANMPNIAVINNPAAALPAWAPAIIVNVLIMAFI